eukprot:TRINITY_DN4032_c0_g1_i1.p1 TRINITY_DN4032_c0_g1~~TRINITY_DN4032_c0_g1_i1.p1  ORF type:complete len:336 (-),score=77.49 TRINITY_DN4032_c0_g1_i1:61-1038(-)
MVSSTQVLNNIEEIIFKFFYNIIKEDNWELLKFHLTTYETTNNNHNGYELACFLRVLTTIQQGLTNNSQMTKRQIYYFDPTLFESQKQSDKHIENVATILKTPRYNLNVFGHPKGLIKGNLKYYIDNVEYSCDKVQKLPHATNRIHNFQTNCRLIIVIENDATFTPLTDSNLCEEHDIILFTACGYPDLSSRIFLRKLVDSTNLPIVSFVDCDPDGILIHLTYKFGSTKLPLPQIPEIKLLGLVPEDINDHEIPLAASIPLTKRDIELIKNKLLEISVESVYFNEELALNQMLEQDLKLELQALHSINFEYPKHYLLKKISDLGL